MIHEDCVNLNPASNVMNPVAEALLARGLGSRPSLGHAGAKHKAGLEAIRGVTPSDMEELASLIAKALLSAEPETMASQVTAFRRRFRGVAYVA